MRGEFSKIYADGREKLLDNAAGKRVYRARTLEMWERQKGLCAICANSIDETQATYDHERGRGLGGGNRDDRIIRDGEWMNAMLCMACQGVKGSRRYEWIVAEYVACLKGDQ